MIGPEDRLALVFYNRIPKAGSSSQENMMRQMAETNGFRFVHETLFKPRHLSEMQQVRRRSS